MSQSKRGVSMNGFARLPSSRPNLPCRNERLQHEAIEGPQPQQILVSEVTALNTLMATMATDWRLVEDAEKDLDFATVFDDEDFLDLFLPAPRSGGVAPTTSHLAPAAHVEERVPTSSSDQHMASHGAPSKPAAEESISLMPSSRQAQPSGMASCQSCVVPFSSASGLMNIVMLVDPVTDQVTLPRQDVIAGEGNRVVTIGPTVLSNFSKLDFSSLSSDVLLGKTDYSGVSKAHHYQEQMEVEPPRTENKFLPISSFSLQSDVSSWNPQFLAAAASQSYALGSMMFPSMNFGQAPQQSAFGHSHAMSSLAPDHPPASMATMDVAGESASYNCVSESSSLDGGSVNSIGGAMAQAAPAPNAVPAPLRALSAYNFFFRDERDRILHGGEIEWTKEKQEKLLHDHWNQDRTKKRRHRKSHGKIDFSTLSKVISTRWKELPEDRKDYFREVAARDWERFQRELAEYKHGASIDAAAGGASAAGANSFASYSFSTVIG